MTGPQYLIAIAIFVCLAMVIISLIITTRDLKRQVRCLTREISDIASLDWASRRFRDVDNDTTQIEHRIKGLEEVIGVTWIDPPAQVTGHYEKKVEI